MSNCPLAQQFLRILPTGVLYEFVKSAKPYIIPCGANRFYILSAEQTAIINFDRYYAKQKVIMQKQSLENINVQVPHIFSPDADSQS